MEYHQFYYFNAVRKRAITLTGSVEEDKLFIRLKFYKKSSWHRVASDPLNYDCNKLAQTTFAVKFSDMKQRLSNNNGSDRGYELYLCQRLTEMGVPKHEHHGAVQKVFEMVEAAVSPVEALIVSVWDNTYRVEDAEYRPNWIPASTSSIEGLQPVTLDADIVTRSPSCAICLEDFEVLDQQQLPVTVLACRHHFHVHCIVQCLEISHLCPLCRYAMPTQED